MATVRRIHAWSSLLHRACTRNSRAAASLAPAWTSCIPRHGDAPGPQRSRAFGLSGCTLRRSDDFTEDRGFTQHDDDGDEEEDSMEEQEADELFRELQPPTALAGGQHRVFVVHPDVKWGSRKQHLTTAELMMAEAVALVNTLDKWSVVDELILSTKTPEKKKIFGKGNFQMLTEKIRRTAGVTAVLVNVERLSPLSERELEDAWGVKVFDRYSLVLHIFRCNAKTKEAKLQISLAEIPLLRSRLKKEFLGLDQQGGGARYIGGSGETQLEVQQRLLREREMKIRSALDKLSRKRRLLRSRRKHKEFPLVSVLGYTNCGESRPAHGPPGRPLQCAFLRLFISIQYTFRITYGVASPGKTTLIKALTGDAGLQPRDGLFATLDVTVHAGRLPGRVTVLYADTIGFLSRLPHRLIDSFAATLEDIKHSDALIHVRDVSHPENVNQKANVLSVLRDLRVPDALMNSVIEVHNKIDLIDDYEATEADAVAVSALEGRGLEALAAAVERRVVAATGKRVLSLKVDLSTPQLSWLYREAAVQDVSVDADEGSAVVEVVIGNAAYGRYRKMFG
ncbi:putative GTP-binding protein 6 isoform X1 [Phyllopteryx taeniolatus]|uniref:putative GTP-binding protein 6 isoform X1 n=1 Tax=Phyllopteryx taeniolatus TaxID=161469 RepID=UPI002AD3A15E|nr:putative GTP-binding protein 6 isoform X1 [Phyllopteryx taeniolatus]